MRDMKKYCFEYDFSSGIDIELTPEEAKIAVNDESFLKDKITETLSEFQCGEAEYIGEGEYPEVLDTDTDNPYIHTRVYGCYTVETIGDTFDKCRQLANLKYENADLGDFTKDGSFERERSKEPDPYQLVLDSSRFIEFVNNSFSNDIIVGINLDECGYSVKATVVDSEKSTVNLKIYATPDKNLNSIVHTTLSEEQVGDLLCDNQLVNDFPNISMGQCEDIMISLIAGEMNDVATKIKKETRKEDSFMSER